MLFLYAEMEAMMEKTIYEVKDSAAWLTIHRADKRNAIDYDVMQELENAIRTANEDPAVKMLIITGTGHQAFCSGGDLSVFHNLKTSKEAGSMLGKMAEILLELFFLPKPTVAFLNGSAVGGGCEIAAACDIRIGYDDVEIGFIQGNLGITTGWGGAAFLMHRLTAPNALDLLASAEKITAEKAYNIGFFQEVFARQDVSQVHQFIERYLKQTGDVLGAYKINYLEGINKEVLKARVYQEVKRCAVLWESETHHRAVERFRNKALRQPPIE